MALPRPGNWSSTAKALVTFFMGLLLGYHFSSNPNDVPSKQQLRVEVAPTPAPTSAGCFAKLPAWVRDETADTLGEEFNIGSDFLTDKSTRHNYQVLYHRYLSNLALRLACKEEKVAGQKPKLRMLEIGLGCSPSGGMIRGEPGGSTRAWRHLFPPEMFDLDLHVMEYDAACARKWEASHQGVATGVHTGDASSPADLDRVVQESGGAPFDLIIDDASHLNEHQIKTFEHLIKQVSKGGIYVIEDIQSSCSSWTANVGSVHDGSRVKGTPGCMETSDGKPTIFSKLVEWQKPLLIKKSPFPNVTSIDIHYESVVISKQWG